MNIWITFCRRKSLCKHCGQDILKATPVVVGKYWRNTESGKKWTIIYHWHPECWLEQGLAELETRPLEQKRRGRTSSFDVATRKDRLKLLRRRAYIIFEIRKAMKIEKVDRIIELSGELDILKEKIVELGGVPNSWRLE